MRVRTHCLAVALLCSVGCLAHAEERRAAYKWVDEKGVAHYGDRIPAEYARKESAVLNKQGVEVDHIEAQKTPEQLARTFAKKMRSFARRCTTASC